MLTFDARPAPTADDPTAFRLCPVATSDQPALVRAKLVGRSMTPMYRQGVIVECQPVSPQADLPLGRDYMVVRGDGKKTFKRLLGVEGETLILVALNRSVCPDLLTVHRSDIRSIALARAIVTPVEMLPLRHRRRTASAA